jgi:hypothetical protein
MAEPIEVRVEELLTRPDPTLPEALQLLAEVRDATKAIADWPRLLVEAKKLIEGYAPSDDLHAQLWLSQVNTCD